MQQHSDVVKKAAEAKIKARRNLRDAEIDFSSGLISGDELAEYEHAARRAEANVKKAEAEEHTAKKERGEAALRARFDAALDRAKEVRTEGFGALTDMPTVERSIVGRVAQSCVDQVAYLEQILMSMHVKASQTAGLESHFDVRGVTGEGQNSEDSLLNRIDRLEQEIAEYETLAIACELKFYELSDLCVKQGLLPEMSAGGTPYFGNAGNYGEALSRARRNQETRQAARTQKMREDNEKVRESMPDIDQLLASRQ